jgi:hypothetical protein
MAKVGMVQESWETCLFQKGPRTSLSRYADIDSSTTTSFTSHGNNPTLQRRTENDDDHRVDSATTTATASMYYGTKKTMLPHQRYNHHFQFFVVRILLPIMIVVVVVVVLVVVATTMRVMVVVRAAPFPTVMLDLGNVETTTTASTTFSPTCATTTPISTSASTYTEAIVFTLRDILTDSTTGFHLAIAPSFFGFFGYFGMLAAWLDDPQEHPYDDQPPLSSVLDQLPIRSVVGATAGMVAILLSANIAPIHAMTFVWSITLDQYSCFLVGVLCSVVICSRHSCINS